MGPDCGEAERGGYAAWLGDSEAADGAAVSAIARQFAPNWVIVDHYALGAVWEEAVRKAARLTMAIDDLADRPHSCDLLLDQNLGRQASDYAGLIPRHTELLTGRSEEHTSELQSLMRISYAVFCLKKKTNQYENKKK